MLLKIIPTRIHGVLDYCVGVLIAVSPWLLHYYRGGAETFVPVVLGIGALLYSACTRYELGLIAVISVRVHLTMDLLSGILLASSPWLFGFADYVWIPHVVFGLFEVAAALTTKTTVSSMAAA